jgi:hypothetical protein
MGRGNEEGGVKVIMYNSICSLEEIAKKIAESVECAENIQLPVLRGVIRRRIKCLKHASIKSKVRVLAENQ